MAVFRQALTMFNPFGAVSEGGSVDLQSQETEDKRSSGAGEVDDLKRQLNELNKKIDNLTRT
jgi:polyhydroxyalkanoate synthesis regulator protein